MARKAAKLRKSIATRPRTVPKAIRKPAKTVARTQTAGKRAVASSASSIVEDHLAITQLLHQYCHAVDRGAADDVAALFHRNAVLLPRYESGDRYEGREAVRGWYQRYMENFRAKVRSLRHKVTSPVIEITGREATSVCYLDADYITESTNQANVAFGRYDDKFIKDEGRWWFKERTIVLYYSYLLAQYREGRRT